MKNKLLILCLVLSGIFFISCSEDSKSIDVQEEFEAFPRVLYGAVVNGLELPDGTKVNVVDNSTIIFEFPENVSLFIKQEDGSYISRSKTRYTCRCSGSNGCNVFYAGGSFGCSHGECTGECTGGFEEIEPDNKSSYFFYDSEMKIEPIKSKTEFKKLPYLPEELLNFSKTQEMFERYALKIYGNNFKNILSKVDTSEDFLSDINNIVFIEMKISGYKFIYGISINDLVEDIYKNNDFENIIEDLSNFTCDCQSGSIGCKKGSRLGVKYCEGGSCSVCSMEMIQ